MTHPQAAANAILVADADTDAVEAISCLVRPNGYGVRTAGSLTQLHALLAEASFAAVLVDIDSIPMANREIRALVRAFPTGRFLCMSTSSFHPELEDAIGRYFYACLKKPNDPDELLFWLKAIEKDNHRAIS